MKQIFEVNIIEEGLFKTFEINIEYISVDVRLYEVITLESLTFFMAMFPLHIIYNL